MALLLQSFAFFLTAIPGHSAEHGTQVGSTPLPPDWRPRVASKNMYVSTSAYPGAPLGNGYVGTQFDGKSPMLVAGVFSYSSLARQGEPKRAEVPTWFVFALSGCTTSASAIDVGRGLGHQSWACGKEATAIVTMYPHRLLPHLLVTEVIVDNTNGTTTLDVGITSTSPWGRGLGEFSTSTMNWTRSPDLPGCYNGTIVASEDAQVVPTIRMAICTQPLASNISVPPGKTRQISFLATLITKMAGSSLHLDVPPSAGVDQAQKELQAAARQDPAALMHSHVAAWEQALAGGIEVEGDDLGLGALINASFHHLISSMREEPEYWYSSSPGGLATNCYNGHTFWDMDTWMFPNLLLFHPSLAMAAAQYRVRGMAWAQTYAMATGRVGARYPWQTAGLGKVASGANANEIHLTGDVAFGLWQLYAATGNRTWLKQDGLPTIRSTADFFAGWAVKNPDGSYSLNGTQGPDEFHQGDDSCYVNAGAMLNLRTAQKYSNQFSIPTPANWSEIGKGLRMPLINPKLHREFEQWTDNDKAKQADTILLGYPLMWPMDSNTQKNDLDYYAAHTGNGPSMTWSMYTVGYLELGDMNNSATFFNRSYQSYLNPQNGNFGGDCNGLFLTGAAGFLQGVWAGWGGIRLHENGMTLFPRVIPQTSGLKFRGLSYKGSRFDMRVSKGQACFKTWSSSEAKLNLAPSGASPMLLTEKESCYPLGGMFTVTAASQGSVLI